ncbi:MAG: hypothetical protein Q4P13_09535, partial [Psychrobacter sp.]|nr:hypothetical protein [Psychrobacter sp.]
MQISSDSLQVDISRDCSQGHHDDCLSLIDGSHDTLIIKSSEGLELTIDTQQAHEILECLAQWFEYELVDKDEKLERKRVAFRQGA